MDRIIKLLSSINFWTISSSIVALFGLIITIYQINNKKKEKRIKEKRELLSKYFISSNLGYVLLQLFNLSTASTIESEDAKILSIQYNLLLEKAINLSKQLNIKFPNNISFDNHCQKKEEVYAYFVTQFEIFPENILISFKIGYALGTLFHIHIFSYVVKTKLHRENTEKAYEDILTSYSDLENKWTKLFDTKSTLDEIKKFIDQSNLDNLDVVEVSKEIDRLPKIVLNSIRNKNDLEKK